MMKACVHVCVLVYSDVSFVGCKVKMLKSECSLLNKLKSVFQNLALSIEIGDEYCPSPLHMKAASKLTHRHLRPGMTSDSTHLPLGKNGHMEFWENALRLSCFPSVLHT